MAGFWRSSKGLFEIGADPIEAGRGFSEKNAETLFVTTIRLMVIEFDSAKNDANVVARGLSFTRAADFDFDTAIIWQDLRKPYLETRYVAVGFLDGRLHVLCFTPAQNGIRVISFRKANPREVKDYEKT